MDTSSSLLPQPRCGSMKNAAVVFHDDVSDQIWAVCSRQNRHRMCVDFLHQGFSAYVLCRQTNQVTTPDNREIRCLLSRSKVNNDLTCGIAPSTETYAPPHRAESCANHRLPFCYDMHARPHSDPSLSHPAIVSPSQLEPEHIERIMVGMMLDF